MSQHTHPSHFAHSSHLTRAPLQSMPEVPQAWPLLVRVHQPARVQAPPDPVSAAQEPKTGPKAGRGRSIYSHKRAHAQVSITSPECGRVAASPATDPPPIPTQTRLSRRAPRRQRGQTPSPPRQTSTQTVRLRLRLRIRLEVVPLQPVVQLALALGQLGVALALSQPVQVALAQSEWERGRGPDQAEEQGRQ